MFIWSQFFFFCLVNSFEFNLCIQQWRSCYEVNYARLTFYPWFLVALLYQVIRSGLLTGYKFFFIELNFDILCKKDYSCANVNLAYCDIFYVYLGTCWNGIQSNFWIYIYVHPESQHNSSKLKSTSYEFFLFRSALSVYMWPKTVLQQQKHQMKSTWLLYLGTKYYSCLASLCQFALFPFDNFIASFMRRMLCYNNEVIF